MRIDESEIRMAVETVKKVLLRFSVWERSAGSKNRSEETIS
jgi:hypothetical protein